MEPSCPSLLYVILSELDLSIQLTGRMCQVSTGLAKVLLWFSASSQLIRPSHSPQVVPQEQNLKQGERGGMPKKAT